MRQHQSFRTSLLLALLGAVFYVPFLGGVHLFDWDEINFAEISREMLITKEYFRVYVNFLPFWEKPPLFFWLQSLGMRAFGVGEFAARLPNALCGMATLVLVYQIGRRLYSHRFGLTWALTYFGTVLPFLYFKSGIIDPWFNFFIFAGLYHFILFYWKKDGFELELPHSRWRYLFLGGFWIGMGILTKGQVAYLIAALTMGVYWVTQRFRMYVSIPQFLFFTFSASLVTLTWYGLETWKNGTWFIEEFNKYQYRLFSTPDAGHRGFPGYHFVVLLIGCFPASILALRAFKPFPQEAFRYRDDFRRWMKYLFWVVLILFSIVKSKIVHYSSMCYFPLTFLAALTLDKIISGEIKFGKLLRAGVWVAAGLFALAIIAAPFVGRNIEMLKPLFKDPFAVENLKAQVHWTGWEALPGVFLLCVVGAALYFFRKGDRASGPADAERQRWTGFTTLFAGTGVFVMLTLIFFIKRVEGYSQRAAIEFYESRIGEDCYVVPHGYRTYAYLFYTRKPKVTNEKSYDRNWLYRGDIDKDVYVVSKIQSAPELDSIPGMKRIGEKNGFVFFRRRVE
ncbi:MAG: glycosyltransferase family 39 protein [Lewinellaceae bacterium]|nr:glycosyltransferase family 39 protein [Lewinellaceae bacterium]